MAYGDHCAVNERYPRTLAESIEPHEEHHFAEYTRHELYKAIIGYRMGELFVEAAADTILIILLKIAIGTEMIAYKNRHNFTFRKPSFTDFCNVSHYHPGWVNAGFSSAHHPNFCQTHR